MSTRFIHAIARVALELPSPLHTKRVMTLVGRFFRPIDVDEARAQIEQLEKAKRGTCLSRAMSVAVRLPGSRVVIGVAREDHATLAHAWIELNGAPIRVEPVATTEIARL